MEFCRVCKLIVYPIGNVLQESNGKFEIPVKFHITDSKALRGT